ncbi:hypothetical protein PPTG_02030 [Phytophthora nicotianae INRA-310]|uniref:Uncharacterized protein n=1 Tax=Phytophthora nicotianae (strain INRA-310) TaxID=761204 RepID=W2R992_PHYN3|nr:hypothetical protein PPTG_02030 [Phytophthora nicotianae INRA-310]ETN21962.1 hypothetical protein PPTG_02030 [Phytophthora nicotianae INRA-310]
MQTNVGFMEELYKVARESDVYRDEYMNKKIVVLFNYAPVLCHIETLVPDHDDFVLLRLGPYIPMCYPIETASVL